MIFLILLNAYLGACLASFALAAAQRTMSGQKWWGVERSVCPACGHILSAGELLPIFSYLLQKARCRHCGAKIGMEYIVSETAGLICGVLFALRFGNNFFALLLCHTAFLFLFFCTYTDISSGYVYDNWAYAMAIFGLVIRLVFGGSIAFCDGLCGSVCAFVFFFAIYLCSRKRGMGLGDACISLGIGAVLGLKLTFVALYIAFVFGALYSIPLLITKRATRKAALPMLPFLSAGVLATLLFGAIVLRKLNFTCLPPFC